MQTGPAKHLGEFHLAHRRAKHLELANDVMNEVGESIHRITNLNERVGAFLVQAVGPGRDCRWCDEGSP